MSYVAVIDYGMGNLDSVRRAVEECGGRPIRACAPEDLREAAHIILPGVGAFSDAIDALRRLGFDEAIREYAIERGIPLLGVCLGMQLLSMTSAEGGTYQGLGMIDADVRRFELEDSALRVPHMGWNEVYPSRASLLFDGIPDGTDFYFVHSYHVQCHSGDDVLATTPYGVDFCCAVNHENLYGVQFHPEKSQAAGMRLLGNFLAL